MPFHQKTAPSSKAAGLRDLQYALDPARLAAAVGMTPDPWQARVLRSGAARLLLNCSRQAGKSTVSSVLGLHTTLYTPDSLVLLVSPSERQSGELFRKLLAVYRDMGRPVPAVSENKFSLELANGSRVVALPGNEENLRGFSAVRLLIIDEASRVADALYRAVRPMLATSDGRLVTMSTPFGKRGWWYEAWQAAHEGREAWDCYEVPASACPRISSHFLAEERASMGEWWFRQEYGCEFVEVLGGLFSPEAIDAAFDAGGDLFFPELEGLLPAPGASTDEDASEDFAL